MLRNNFCFIKENVSRRHRRTNSQFLRHVMHEELENKVIKKQEIITLAENHMIMEQKLQRQICSEVQKLKKETFLEEKRKHLLMQNEDELRVLDTQIKRARLQRGLVNQKAFKETKLNEQFQARLEEHKHNEEKWKRSEKIEKEKEIESYRKKGALRQDLLKQMQEKDDQRKLEKKIIKEEQKSRQTLLESIKQDIKMEEQSLLELKQRLRKERDEYVQKAAWYRYQREADVEEDNRIYEEVMRQRQEAKRLRAEKRNKAVEERAAHSQQIGQQVYTIQMEKQNRNEFLQELLVEERLAKDDERDKKYLEEEMQKARALQNDFQRFFLEKQHKILLKREEERNLAKQKLFNNLEHTDNEIKNLKLLKNEKYRQDLLNAVKLSNSEREREVQQNKAQYEEQLTLQKKREQEIEMEKLTLLKTLPVEDFKFLPAKAISVDHRALLGLAPIKAKKGNM